MKRKFIAVVMSEKVDELGTIVFSFEVMWWSALYEATMGGWGSF